MPTSSSFTLKHGGRVNALPSPCHVMAAFDPRNPPNPLPPAIEFNAIWDTGATGTVITQEVVDRLGLAPTGMIRTHTANGERDVNTYLVNVRLPNSVGFVALTVACCPLGPGADVLIGMDIIGSGDFAVSNHDGKTVMTFRHPSSKCIDFVKEHQDDARSEVNRSLIKKRPKKNRKKHR